MIKILVMSDNHGDLKIMDKIINFEKPNFTIHCGDYLVSTIDMKKRFDYFVPGNNDAELDGLEMKATIGGFKFLIMHGHTAGNKIYSPEKLIRLARESGCDALIHGHLHIPIYFKEENTYVFCPGSTTYPRNEAGSTYGLIFIEDSEIKFEHKTVKSIR